MEKIYFVNSIDIGDGEESNLSLDEHYYLLEEEIEKIGDVALIIFDPITSFLGKVKDYIDSEVRGFLAKLNRLLKKHNIGCVLNKHLRKQKSGHDIGSAMDEISGSNAWIAVARQSFIIAQHPEHEDIVLFSHLKTNIRKKIKEAYAYKIKEHNYKNQNGIRIKTSFIEWENQIYKISTEAILNKDAYEKSRMEAAIQFILNWLEQYGQSLSSVIRENALSNGILKLRFSLL